MTDEEKIIDLQLQVDELDASRRALSESLAATTKRELMMRMALEEIARVAKRAMEPYDPDSPIQDTELQEEKK